MALCITRTLIPKTTLQKSINADTAFPTPSASLKTYEQGFFRQTTRDWNHIPDSFISDTVVSDDYESKLNFLVRTRDKCLPVAT